MTRTRPHDAALVPPLPARGKRGLVGSFVPSPLVGEGQGGGDRRTPRSGFPPPLTPPHGGGGGRVGVVSRAAALLVALLGVVFLATAAMAQPKFPALTDRIVDEAGLLTAADRATIREDLKQLEAKSSDQLVIFTTKSLQGYPIEDFGYQLGRAWGIGQQGTNNGVILLVAPNERKVRIEVGRGLEPQLTDALTKLIIENAILPAFRRGDFAAGVKAGVHDIKDVLLGDAEAVKQRLAAAPKRNSNDNSWIPMAFFFFFVLVAFSMIYMQQVQTAHPNAARRRNRNGYVPGSWDSGNWGGSSGGWSGGGSSDSGGGFSGGGGDFGGGGSSGSW